MAMKPLTELEYRTDGGVHHRIRYERDSSKSRVYRTVFEQTGHGEWRVLGVERLDELIVDDEHRMPRHLTLAADDSPSEVPQP